MQGGFVGQWVAEQQKALGFDAKFSKAIGLKRNEKLVAGVIYESWNGVSFVCHAAVIGRLTKEFLVTVFYYPFVQCGARKIITPVISSNLRALQVVSKLGFVEEGRIRQASPDGDIVLLTLEKEQCRFLDW